MFFANYTTNVLLSINYYCYYCPQLSGVGSLEGGSEWLTVVAEVRSTIGELETLHSNATAIAQYVHYAFSPCILC